MAEITNSECTPTPPAHVLCGVVAAWTGQRWHQEEDNSGQAESQETLDLVNCFTLGVLEVNEDNDFEVHPLPPTRRSTEPGSVGTRTRWA